ncbi:hypothetical protein SAMN02910298_02000 [Pseudobutyrivibrio sp. YE44]|uniref:hypothetical protein n=1 Tax=Pseudobutyrivibrio sp. YE44 TaxID=1520802 RepID=UPI0008802A11|nr:hypothetical protein [Pseudobutyrivibrio sp. YE44]SDB40659.1 hypothetical protein SAMN02910298_02000 [Pseudobutyrivibrio sp. YE44]
MRKEWKKVLALSAAIAMTSGMLAGCGDKTEEAATENTQATTETTETTEAKTGAPYFIKGVYANYSAELENPTKDYFYVFNDEGAGHTEDATTGLPFSCTQEEGKVIFTFGGEGESEENLIITDVKDDFIYGYFEDVKDKPLVFEFLPDVDPDTFVAENYLSDGTSNVYSDANGWSVHYNPDLITVNTQGNVTTFVYTGDCPGTCMVSVTYDVDMKAKEKSEALAKDYGEGSNVSEGIFPGTEDVKGYWVTNGPSEGGPGMYNTAILRDYMDGYLVFEDITHVGGDEEQDMAISDALAGIIDSLEFTNN